MSTSVLHARLAEFEQRGLVHRNPSTGYVLTRKGQALMESLTNFETWVSANSSMTAEALLDRAERLTRQLFPGSSLERTREGIVVDLGAARLAVVCRGDDSVEVYLRTSDKALKRRWQDSSGPASQALAKAFRSVDVGHRAYLRFEWFLADEDYGPVFLKLKQGLQWLAEKVQATAGVEDGDDVMDKWRFLTWVEKLLAQYDSDRSVDQSGSRRHYRRIRAGKHRYLAVDAMESQSKPWTIRVHLLSSDSAVTERWKEPRLSLPEPPAATGGRPRYRQGQRGGAQQYFGYEWPNEPGQYRNALPRVKACADYLWRLVQDGLA